MDDLLSGVRAGAACACTGACRVTGVCPLHGGVMFTQEDIAFARAHDIAIVTARFFEARTIGNPRSMLRFTEAELATFIGELVAISGEVGLLPLSPE